MPLLPIRAPTPHVFRVLFQVAKELGPGKVIATVLCDAGQQYSSTVYNQAWLESKGLTPKASGHSIEFVSTPRGTFAPAAAPATSA